MALFTLDKVAFKDIVSYPYMEMKEEGTSFICGDSGSGKSTLLKLCNGTISPTSGDISYLGKNILTMDPVAYRREVLLVGQAVFLFDASIEENFQRYLDYRGEKAISQEEIKQYLEICALQLPLDSSCNVLSGGERQRVFIAIHLALKPKVLMLDEPSSALDDKNATILMENLRAHCKAHKMALLVVSHDKHLAKTYADHVILLEGGGGNG